MSLKASQTFQIRIDLPESAHDLVAAGQLVSIAMPLTATPALTVPRDSIVSRSPVSMIRSGSRATARSQMRRSRA